MEHLNILKKSFQKVKILKGSGNLYWGGAVNLAINFLRKKLKKMIGYY